MSLCHYRAPIFKGKGSEGAASAGGGMAVMIQDVWKPCFIGAAKVRYEGGLPEGLDDAALRAPIAPQDASNREDQQRRRLKPRDGLEDSARKIDRLHLPVAFLDRAPLPLCPERL